MPNFTCARCGKDSAHPDDRRAGWCNACQEFTTSPETDEMYERRLAREAESA